MTFKPGDNVLVLDEAASGVVENANTNTVYVRTNDGFLVEFKAKALIKKDPEATLSKNLPPSSHMQAIIREKEKPTTKHQNPPKVKHPTTTEVDLHSNKLIENTKHLSNHDILTLQLNTAKHHLNLAITQHVKKVIFIHGVGKGVLKLELKSLLARYKHVTYCDADYSRYGSGATEVHIHAKAAPKFR